MRSLSFTRSSPASRISVTPSANAAATASTGISSCTSGISSPAMVVAVQRRRRHVQITDRFTELLARDVDVDGGAHPAQHVDERDPRRVAAPRLRSRGRNPGVIVAPTTQKAADDGSPGTSSSKGDGAPAVTRTVQPSTVTGAPSARSIRSVWSRLGAGSAISVVPSACSPARTSAVFTCALATDVRCACPCKPTAAYGERRERARRRGRRSCAPIARSGSTTRPIGRCTQARVTGEHREERPAGEQPGSGPHRGAGVAAVEDLRGFDQSVDARVPRR